MTNILNNIDRLAAKYWLLSVLAAFSIHAATPNPVLASSTEHGFTDLFNTYAFSGSWEVLTKFNFIGGLMSTCISVFSFFGLVMVILRLLITLVYLSSKNVWNTVADLKSKGRGSKFFGIGSMAKEVSNGNFGVGLDSIVGFLMMLLPNIKEYSDYGEGAGSKYNYEETDTITMYLLKSALPTIMTIFIFSMGWNGVLWKAYANVADGMGVAAEAFTNERLETIVNNALNTGSSPTFGYSADGTKYGSFKQSVAKNIYNKVIAKTTDLETADKLGMGEKIDVWIADYLDYACYYALGLCGDYANDVEDYIYSNGTLSKTATVQLASVEVSDQEAGNLKYSVVINKTESYMNSIDIDAASLGLTGDSGWYIHLFISKKANSNETNWFEYKPVDDNKNKQNTEGPGEDSNGL